MSDQLGAAYCGIRVVYLEIGDRRPGDEASYPNDDIQAALGTDGNWQFTHKDGRLC